MRKMENKMTKKVENASAEILRGQKWYVRRKDSLATFAAGLLQIIQIFAVGEMYDNPVLSIFIGAIIFISNVVLIAATPQALTGRSAEKIIEKVREEELSDSQNEKIVSEYETYLRKTIDNF